MVALNDEVDVLFGERWRVGFVWGKVERERGLV